jgi:hypothetical protein
MTAAPVRAITGLFMTVLLLGACSDDLSVEQHIIGNLEQMEAAAEQGRHLDFMSHVADGFGGQHGSMDRREFHRFMIFQMNENRRLHANLFPIHVREPEEQIDTGDIDDPEKTGATAQFRILVLGGAGLLPERGQLYEVKTRWIKEGSDWLLHKADWETVQAAD